MDGLQSALVLETLFAILSVAAAPPQPDLREALTVQATAAYEAGDWATAAAAWGAASAIEAEPSALLGIARSHASWDGHCGQAKAAFERFFSRCGTCNLESTGRAALAEARARCKTSVTIKSKSGKATVVVDGREVGAAPQTIELWAGPHVVTVRRGASFGEQAFCATPNAKRTVTLKAKKPKKGGAAAVVARARQHEQAALRHLRSKDSCSAALSLRKAHEAVSVPKVLFNLGLVYDKWPGHCSEAVDAYRRYLEGCPACGKAKTAKERLDALRTSCIATVTVTSAPAAPITIDGASVTAPIGLRPGDHIAAARLDGHEPAAAAFNLTAGESKRIDLRLAALPPPPPEPAFEPPPPVVIAPAPPLEESGSAMATAGWVGVGVGAAALILGGVFHALALDTHGNIEQLQIDAAAGNATRGAISDEITAFNTQGSVAYAGYGVGGGLAALGLLLVAIDAAGD